MCNGIGGLFGRFYRTAGYASRNIMPQDGTPYELEFMQQVVSEVAGTRAPMTELQPTHLYVEFAPATLEEYDRLLAAPQFECLPFDVFEVPELPQGAAYAVQPPCEGSANSMRWFAAI